jgi:hypothetical protein
MFNPKHRPNNLSIRSSRSSVSLERGVFWIIFLLIGVLVAMSIFNAVLAVAKDSGVPAIVVLPLALVAFGIVLAFWLGKLRGYVSFRR